MFSCDYTFTGCCFYVVCFFPFAANPIPAVTEFVAQLVILELLDNVCIHFFFSSSAFGCSLIDQWHYFCIKSLGYFYCWVQGCSAYPLCGWGMWDCWTFTANWYKDKEAFEKESSLCEEWRCCSVPCSGTFFSVMNLEASFLSFFCIVFLYINKKCNGGSCLIMRPGGQKFLWNMNQTLKGEAACYRPTWLSTFREHCVWQEPYGAGLPLLCCSIWAS